MVKSHQRDGWLRRTESILLSASRVCALVGGGIVAVMALISVVSILGRWLSGWGALSDLLPWVRGIPGDFELVQIGTALAVFAFLPYTQMKYGHVTIDIIVDLLPPRAKMLFTALSNTLFTVVAAIMTRQLYFGLEEKMVSGEASMILGIPVWFGFVPSVLMLGLLTLTCAYTALDSVCSVCRPVAGRKALSKRRRSRLGKTGIAVGNLAERGQL